MSNNISYANKYAGEIDKLITQGTKTGFLADSALKAKFTGAKGVYIPELTMVGLGNHTRGGSFTASDINLVHTLYEMKQERQRQLYIDAQDVDESGVPGLVGQMVGEYNRQHVIPEIDAYNISTMFAIAKEKGNTKGYAEATAVADFLGLINSAEAAMEYDGSTQLVALVDPTLYNVLMTSAELQRHIVTSDFKQGEINLKVKNLNGCNIIPVAAGRMKSEFIFDTGADPAKGGFTPAEGAKDVRALVLPTDSASLVKKVDKVDVHAPGKDVNRDGYVINFRLYYDLFVKNSRKHTIFGLEG